MTTLLRSELMLPVWSPGESLSAVSLAERGIDLPVMSPQLASLLQYHWSFWARPNQLPPADGDWLVWFFHAGRGAGKSKSGAEWVRTQIETGACRRMALVGASMNDVVSVMVEGPSGLLAICPPWARPRLNLSKRELRWPNGGVCKLYSAEDPEQLRGPQHDGAWCDELAKWRYEDAWTQLQFGLRIGKHPRTVVTTTLRPRRWVKQILDQPTTIAVGGSTFDNEAHLSQAMLASLRKTYDGMRLGRQELYGEYLEDTPGALWNRSMFEVPGFRLDQAPTGLRRVVVAIDPAVSSNEGSDETGIVVCGKDDRDHFYILADYSGRMTPEQWSRKAIDAFDAFKADCIVAEVNNGGDMVESVIRNEANHLYASCTRHTREVPIYKVHASRGKVARAQPISMHYEQKRAHHVGQFQELEEQMAQFLPDGMDFSPDRVDALVWGVTECQERRGWQGFVL